VIFQDRDTGSAALLPAPQTIIDWEHEGATEFAHFVRTKTMFFFEDCAPQPKDSPARYQS
jgi:hypothetical protein